MAEPYELSLTEAVAEVAARRLSALELTESLLARIDAVEPRLLAWATLLPERALDAARAHDAGAASSGPLAGVPYGAKDIFDTAGVLTACGSKVWAERVPDADAAAVVRARDAGAILLGKLHTTEFADGDPAPSFNPWNAEHTPGGSSAGSGVAVAARMVPWAFGSQTVGSVLRPACYNGVVGFKPTFGRISRAGVVPMATSFDHVGDAKLADAGQVAGRRPERRRGPRLAGRNVCREVARTVHPGQRHERAPRVHDRTGEANPHLVRPLLGRGQRALRVRQRRPRHRRGLCATNLGQHPKTQHNAQNDNDSIDLHHPSSTSTRPTRSDNSLTRYYHQAERLRAGGWRRSRR